MEKLKSMLGFAQKSGNLVSGMDSCEIAMKKGKLKLLFIASDAANNTMDKASSMCKYREIPYSTLFTKEELSQAIGKFNRTVVGIVDEKFANRLKELIIEMVEE